MNAQREGWLVGLTTLFVINRLRLHLLNFSFHNGYNVRLFRIQSRGQPEQRQVKHVHYTNWPDFGIPSDSRSFLQIVHEFENEAESILVHCSAGLGRSGVFITTDAALRIFGAGLYVDVPKIVTKLRQQRDGMIQTHEQYHFVYKTIAEDIQSSVQGSRPH